MTFEFRYEDIFKREQIISHVGFLGEDTLVGERVLITGAGGSIGSQIVKEIAKFKGVIVLATDRDENRLHSLSLDLMGTALFESHQFQVLDIKDARGVVNCVKSFAPTTIIHAAALKHLAILEKQPREALLTNIVGTSNLLIAAFESKVNRFLNISTDKAANPISILGKSKYIGELLTAEYQKRGMLHFSSVRFGNVFNSRGSVIETFSRQLASGRALTLTSTDVSRYFMRIEEAASLSIIVAFQELASDVYVLDMGPQVKLIDIVQRMKSISGSSSKIEIVGLRKGEKMEEELWSNLELVSNTSHPSIFSIKLSKSYKHLPAITNEVADDEQALEIIEQLIPN